MNMQIHGSEDQVATELGDAKLAIPTVMSFVDKDWKLRYKLILHYHIIH